MCASVGFHNMPLSLTFRTLPRMSVASWGIFFTALSLLLPGISRMMSRVTDLKGENGLWTDLWICTLYNRRDYKLIHKKWVTFLKTSILAASASAWSCWRDKNNRGSWTQVLKWTQRQEAKKAWNHFYGKRVVLPLTMDLGGWVTGSWILFFTVHKHAWWMQHKSQRVLQQSDLEWD